MILVQAVFWFVLALLLACVEIESEGKYGWAQRMPTWYRTKGIPAKIFGFLLGKKPLTGYHLFLISFIFLMFHMPFVMQMYWSLAQELVCIALLIAWWILEDFIWFILNPYYGIKNFKRSNIWWHSKRCWLFGLVPMDYIYGLTASVIVVCIAGLLKDVGLIFKHLQILGLWILFLTIIIVSAPLYKKWYFKMREDDRRNIGF